jgi:hypothetical protein
MTDVFEPFCFAVLRVLAKGKIPYAKHFGRKRKLKTLIRGLPKGLVRQSSLKGEKTMKRKLIFSIALIFGLVLLSVVKSDSTSQAQRRQMLRWYETGIVDVGPGQMFCATVVNPTNEPVSFTLIELLYQETCANGFCQQTEVQEQTFGPMTLAPGQGVSRETTPGQEVRLVIQSNGQLASLSHIVDTDTGKTNAAYPLTEWMTK